ncbi:hypothetical protein SH449x_003075 [Pirellulaceae bacterium SH449]
MTKKRHVLRSLELYRTRILSTFEWASLKLYCKVAFTDFLVMVIVTLYTAVMHDLASAVIIGMIVSSLAFAFKNAKNDPDTVVIDFYYTRVYDHSGMEAIHSIATKYQQLGKTLHLTHLSEECRGMICKAKDLICVSISDGPQFHVSTDKIAKQTRETEDSTLTMQS